MIKDLLCILIMGLFSMAFIIIVTCILMLL